MTFEEANPITHLMTARDAGLMDPEVLDERVMSAIVEFRTVPANVAAVLGRLHDVADHIDTVMAVGVYARCDAEGQTELDGILAEEGVRVVRAKTNLGLGRAAGRRLASAAGGGVR